MSVPGVQPDRLQLASEPDRTASWELTYRENVEWVYRYVFGRLGNRADAEDVTAEVFMRSLPRLRAAVLAPQLRAYLLMTARTLIAQHWRTAFHIEVTDQFGAEVPAALAELEGRADQNARRVSGLLARLPQPYRRVLELRFLHGYSVRETADALRISIANAKVLQHRALRRAAEVGWDDLA